MTMTMKGQVLLITPEYLDRLMTGLRDEMRTSVMELKTHMTEETLTRKEAARYLKIGIKALDKRIQSGQIPKRLVHKNGGTPYFFASELEQFLKES